MWPPTKPPRFLDFLPALKMARLSWKKAKKGKEREKNESWIKSFVTLVKEPKSISERKPLKAEKIQHIFKKGAKFIFSLVSSSKCIKSRSTDT